jgi:hypothetical protein
MEGWSILQWKDSPDNTEAIIQGGELLREGHPAFTVFVTGPGPHSQICQGM